MFYNDSVDQADVMSILGILTYGSFGGALAALFIAFRRTGVHRHRWLIAASACGALVVTSIIGLILAEFIEDWPFVLSAAIAAALGFCLLVWSSFSDRSRGRPRCPTCWYDMSNAPAEASLRCPECGRKAKRERSLFKTPALGLGCRQSADLHRRGIPRRSTKGAAARLGKRNADDSVNPCPQTR